ncbi:MULTISPECIES: biotin/lipoyl-containing protein [Proteiniphilum]|uniref:acetyl-CoA carboxylase biotin carboxyl carrier protein n=1 Tax=Proteiniphilum TaxID=294702 RepID=UPI0028AFB32B|nr:MULTISPECIES: biotin/lipoyl-containing protein [Proteiniphilum]MDY9919790.1 biotin/lipoyl-containing protein [Proteiniphilum sp.]
MKEFNYKINGAPYRVVVTKSDTELVELEVNGTPYTVEITPKAKKPKAVVQRHSVPPGPVPQSSTSHLVTKPAGPAGKNTIQSPLPGVILDIRCKVGDTVKKGQTLMILEAMKMENNILANGNGKVTEILIQKGDSVLEGADLVVIE